MKKHWLKKLQNASGFTLVEVLVAMLILLMVTAVVAGAMPVARDAYYKVVDSANAQVLLSTTATALRDELGTAKEIELWDGDAQVEANPSGGSALAFGEAGSAAGKRIAYISPNTGAKSSIWVGTSGKAGETDVSVYLREYVDLTADESFTRPLVSKKAATDRLCVTFDSVTLNNEILTITGLKVKSTVGSGQVLASLDTFTVRVAIGG